MTKKEMVKFLQLRENDLWEQLAKARKLYNEVKEQHVGPGTLASYEHIYNSTRAAWVELNDLLKEMGIDTLRYNGMK